MKESNFIEQQKYPKTIEDKCLNHGITTFRIYKFKRNKSSFRYVKKCLKCESNKRQKAKNNRKEEYINLLGGKCSKCGYNSFNKALHFHHVGNKRFNISQRLLYSHQENIKELKNCILLCSNCHQKTHSAWAENLDTISNIRHWRKFHLYKAFGNQCMICFSKDIATFQFHHLKIFNKEINLSKREILEAHPTILWKEAQKCILLCANCHAEVEHGKHKGVIETKFNLNAPHNKLSFRNWISMIDRTKQEIIFLNEEDHTIFKKISKSKYCKDCSKKLINNSIRCKECASKKREKIIWPSLETLQKELSNKSYVKLGKELGVSDNAIRKHLRKKYNLTI